MRRRKFLLQSSRAAAGLPFLGLLGCSHTSPNSGPTHPWSPLIAELKEQLPRLMAETFVPGLSMALVKQARLVWAEAFGVRNSDSGALVDRETVFEAGSTSKPVFAYLTLKLCEKGILTLDTPLTKLTTERFLEGDSRLDLITARHVLSHTSGFQNWRTGREPLKIHFAPGERFLYSGEGYYYLQSVITHLGGKVDPRDCAAFEADLKVCATDFDSYARKNLLSPFRMNASGYLWNDRFEKNAAHPHDGKGKPMQRRIPTGPSVARYAAAGGLITTPSDYAKFIIEMMNARHGDTFRLNKASITEMIRPHVNTGDKFGSSWALGWQVQRNGAINHGGYNPGFNAHVAVSLSNNSAVVMMTNGDKGGELINRLGQTVQRFLAA